MSVCTFGSGPHRFGRGGEALQCFGERGHGQDLIFPLDFGSCVAAVGSGNFCLVRFVFIILVMKGQS